MEFVGPCVGVNNGKMKNKKMQGPYYLGTAAATNVVFSIFLLIELENNITIKKYQTNPNTTYTN